MFCCHLRPFWPGFVLRRQMNSPIASVGSVELCVVDASLDKLSRFYTHACKRWRKYARMYLNSCVRGRMLGDSTVNMRSRFFGVFGLPTSVLLLCSWGTWTGGVFWRSFSRSVSTSNRCGDTVRCSKNATWRVVGSESSLSGRWLPNRLTWEILKRHSWVFALGFHKHRRC